MNRHNPKTRLSSLVVALILCLPCLLAGCGGDEEVKLEDFLEELEFESPLEMFKEVELGQYQISSAALASDMAAGDERSHWVAIRFKISVATTPADESAILAATERHRGMLDDAILGVCRSASVHDLEDNRWAAIKSRLIDRIRPILGAHRVRQITLFDFEWEPI